MNCSDINKFLDEFLSEELSPLEGIIGPVPQSNGLREYKIPNGTSVQPYASLK